MELVAMPGIDKLAELKREYPSTHRRTILNHTAQAAESEARMLTELIERVNSVPFSDGMDYHTVSRISRELIRLRGVVLAEWGDKQYEEISDLYL